jgi:hypothetical protein
LFMIAQVSGQSIEESSCQAMERVRHILKVTQLTLWRNWGVWAARSVRKITPPNHNAAVNDEEAVHNRVRVKNVKNKSRLRASTMCANVKVP